jgi:hypothetical protein
LPAGQITSPSILSFSSPFRKNISVFPKCKSGYMICHPVPKEGALRNVINAGRAAVDADGAFDESASSGRRNRVVLAPRRWCQVGGVIRR